MATNERMRRYIAVLLIYLFGLTCIAIFGETRLRAVAENKVHWINTQLNTALTDIDTYYKNTLDNQIPVINCKRFLEDSQQLLLSSPYIRNISAANGGVIVCNSITGTMMTQIKDWQAAKQQVSLYYVEQSSFAYIFPDNQKNVLTLRYAKTDYYSFIVALYPELIFKLFGANQYYISTIEFSNATFRSDGRIIQNTNILPDGKLFVAHYALPVASVARYTFHNYGLLVFAWTFMILIGAKPMVGYMNTFSLDYWRVRRAISRKQFVPYIQPVFDAYGNVTGGEVLVRWLHPRKGVIPPSVFIELVEENGQIIQITSQLIEQCAQAFNAIDMPPRESFFRLGFNVAPLQLNDPQLIEDIAAFQIKLLNKPVDIILELIERNEFASDKYQSTIANLRNRNVLIALDDFGTGNCSLKYLYNTQIDMIKIDRLYVATIDSGEHTKLLENIISLARSLDVPLLAEGVETQTQFEYLKNMNIERYQGFFFARPMPLNDFIERYISNKKDTYEE